jgi:hypothetical protein
MNEWQQPYNGGSEGSPSSFNFVKKTSNSGDTTAAIEGKKRPSHVKSRSQLMQTAIVPKNEDKHHQDT